MGNFYSKFNSIPELNSYVNITHKIIWEILDNTCDNFVISVLEDKNTGLPESFYVSAPGKRKGTTKWTTPIPACYSYKQTHAELSKYIHSCLNTMYE